MRDKLLQFRAHGAALEMVQRMVAALGMIRISFLIAMLPEILQRGVAWVTEILPGKCVVLGGNLTQGHVLVGPLLLKSYLLLKSMDAQSRGVYYAKSMIGNFLTVDELIIKPSYNLI